MSSLEPSSQNSQSTAIRNPRRRQRVSGEDGSSRQQQPQRKRHKTNADGFRSSAKTQDEILSVQMNGHADSTSTSLQIPVRGKQQHGLKRGYKDEGSIILTQNPNYVVKQLPGLPESIRVNRREPHRGGFLPSAGYALTLTRTQAFVWDYSSASSTPPARVFTLQHPSRPTEPLPLGSLIPSVSGGETGLVVINATSGKITHWESVENADALSLFEQRKNGIVGSCGSLFSGEVIVDIENADPVGFILRFSSGRTAQLLLRDLQSRPAISVRFFQSQSSSSGILSGLKSVFTSGQWMKNVVAARSHTSQQRGFAETILANADAHFQFWQVSWAGQTLFRGEIDAKAAINAATSSLLGDAGQQRQVRVIDFAIFSKSTASTTSLVVRTGTAEISGFFDLLVLVAIVGEAQTAFALVELEIVENLAMARRTISLHSFTSTTNDFLTWTPKVLLPGVQDTAFVIFERAIALVSLATIKLSPEAQILMDVESLPEPFQDVVYLKDGHEFCITGVSAEDNVDASMPSSILLFVENYGVLRITTTTPLDDEQAIERSRVSAKSKIEQAVFFGSVAENPLDLFRISEPPFPIEEIEAAALETSREICATDSQYLPTVAPSMEYHLEQRAHILECLASYLKQHREISKITRWKLRWDAEKIAAARKIWSVYNEKLNNDPNQDTRLLPQILLLMHEKFKTPMADDQGERDRVRWWFLKDVWRMENLVIWPWQALHNLEENNEIHDSKTYLEYVGDACDIALQCLETAFRFREESAKMYGLENESLVERGEELPELWTSSYLVQRQLPSGIGMTMNKLLDLGEEQFVQHEKLCEYICQQLPALIDVYCKSAEERYEWLCAHPEAETRNVSSEFKSEYERNRSRLIKKLPQFNQTMQGLALAENYEDMEALVILVQDLSHLGLFDETKKDDPEVKKQINAIEERVKRYFETYKDAWANAFYSYQISRAAFTRLLDQGRIYGSYLTRYLRAEPTREKLSWINDILSEEDYSNAGNSLLNVAEKQETDLWSKKVELSIAKLALAANQDQNHSEVSKAEQNNALQLIKLQEKLYDHVQHSFYDAVDQPAELQLAMQAYGTHTVKGRHNLQQLLERCMERLVNHEAMDIAQLVDVFTLMDQRANELETDDISGQEMFLALEALKSARNGKYNAENDLLLKITYRRCFIRDNWKQIDSTAQKSDQNSIEELESTTLFRTFYEGYASGLWNNESGIPMLYPDELLGAVTTPEELKPRFSDSDLCGRLAKDMAVEDGILQQFVTKFRLNHWIKAAEELAKNRLKLEAEEKAERAEKIRQVAIQLEADENDLKKHRGPKDVSGASEGVVSSLVNGD